MINEFRGVHRFLSNFYPVKIEWIGRTFPTSENAYQASKCRYEADVETFVSCLPGDAKRFGRKMLIRHDWESVKLTIMEGILNVKFAPDTLMATMLVDTGNEELVEGNCWGDRFWGVCGGEGENHLGKLLMSIREKLRGGTET